MSFAEDPTIIIDTPVDYERTHELAQCPLCKRPNPILDMHIPVRELGYVDISLYVCDTLCECKTHWDFDPITEEVKPHKHKFSVKHEIIKDARHLKIYDRTHKRDVW